MLEADETHTKNLSQLQASKKEEYIKVLTNFPRITPKLQEGHPQAFKIIAQCFPRGCAGLIQPKPTFIQGDSSLHIHCQDLTNVYIGLKYGICSASIEHFAGIKRRFDRTLELGHKSYVLITSSSNKLIALGEIVSVRPDMTFRFWKRTNAYFGKEENALRNFGRSYNVGTFMINYLALGDIPYSLVKNIQYQPRQLDQAYNLLKARKNQYDEDPIRWSHFEIADQQEEKSRRKYIQILRQGTLMKEWQEVEKKNKELLEKILQNNKVGDSEEDQYERKDDDDK